MTGSLASRVLFASVPLPPALWVTLNAEVGLEVGYRLTPPIWGWLWQRLMKLQNDYWEALAGRRPEAERLCLQLETAVAQRADLRLDTRLLDG